MKKFLKWGLHIIVVFDGKRLEIKEVAYKKRDPNNHRHGDESWFDRSLKEIMKVGLLLCD